MNLQVRQFVVPLAPSGDAIGEGVDRQAGVLTRIHRR